MQLESVAELKLIFKVQERRSPHKNGTLSRNRKAHKKSIIEEGFGSQPQSILSKNTKSSKLFQGVQVEVLRFLTFLDQMIFETKGNKTRGSRTVRTRDKW